MAVQVLNLSDFRNFSNLTVNFHQDLNFVIGANGSGKSSLLEAIFYLGHGKSFRTSKFDSLVAFEREAFTVSTKDFENRRLGVSRNKVTNEVKIKLDGVNHSKLSDLAKNIAVQIVTPESFKLFFGGAKERRKFVDLGMFHVKHSFPKQWKEFSIALKQRNACLRNREHLSMLNYWTEIFCKYALILSESRIEYLSELADEVKVWLKILLPNIAEDITIQYSRGWNRNKDLADVLQDSYERELKYGYSLFGAQKFDVQFLIKKQPIDIKLSRGQQKLFLLALTFAQAKIIKQVKRVKPILLIDDIGAELDLNSRTMLSTAISRLNCQVIITAIEEHVLAPFILDGGNDKKLVSEQNNYNMFHVEHGQISAMNRLKL